MDDGLEWHKTCIVFGVGKADKGWVESSGVGSIGVGLSGGNSQRLR